MTVAAPHHWTEQPVYRACVLCTHGRGPNTDRFCVCPEVTGRRLTAVGAAADKPIGVLVAAARATTGPCGPDANHLAFTGLR